MAYGIDFGNVVTDPAEQDRITKLGEGVVSRNEAGGQSGYAPGYSRDQAVRDAAYSFFPSHGGGSMSGGAMTNAGGSGGFSMAAPQPTKYADFAPPDPLSFDKSPDYQFRLAEGQKALEHSAAARGSYFTPNTMQGLTANAQGQASAEYGNAYNRALQTYGTNRDTAQQYFGNQTTAFNGGLAATTADRNFSLAKGAQDFDQAHIADQTAYDRSIYKDNTQYDRHTGPYATQPNGQPWSMTNGQPWVDPNAAQNAAISASIAGPQARPRSVLAPVSMGRL